MSFTREPPDAMKMDCCAANSQQSDNKGEALAIPGAHQAHPVVGPSHPFEKGQSDEVNSVENHESHSAFPEALDAAHNELAALRAENRDLRDRAAALEALNAHAASLSALLALSNFYRCVAASPLPDANAMEAAAAGVFDMAYAGGQPEDHMFDLIVRLPPKVYWRIDNASRSRYLALLMQWKAEPSAAVRASLRQRALHVLRVRERGRHRLALMYPEALVHLWREGLPDNPAHVIAQRRKQAQMVAALDLKPKQVELITAAWREFCAGIDALEHEAVVAAMFAGIGTAGEPDERGPLQNRAKMAQGTVCNVARIRRANARRVALYSRLIRRVTQALTWVQAASIAVATAPYAPEYTEFCQQVLTEIEESSQS